MYTSKHKAPLFIYISFNVCYDIYEKTNVSLNNIFPKKISCYNKRKVMRNGNSRNRPA